MPTELQLPAGVPPLRTYYMYITGACNLACRHCWITPRFLPTGQDASQDSLPFDLFELAIREGEPLGVNHLKLTGGEPFVHPQIQRMLDYAAERGLGVTIETNGTLITADWARYLQEKTTVRSISVSLDGSTAATHDYLRGVAGSLARAQAGIRHLVDAGYHPQVIMSLYEGNLDEIERLARWAETAGCSSLKLNIIRETGRGGCFEERVQGIERLIALGGWVETELQESIRIPVHYSWPPAFQRIRYLTGWGGCGGCDIFSILGILSTGEMALCGIGVHDRRLVYGVLGTHAVREVWSHHPVTVSIRESLPCQLQGICGKCLFRDWCLGFCVADNYHRSGSALAPFWFCDCADQAGRFPVARQREAIAGEALCGR
jgi:SynChlorMet cassette radical SAM/SPASM protein ScmF